MNVTLTLFSKKNGWFPVDKCRSCRKPYLMRVSRGLIGLYHRCKKIQVLIQETPSSSFVILEPGRKSLMKMWKCAGGQEVKIKKAVK